ncbi:TonB-dependent receptor domain-containing protein [Sphingomonas asaccharolytica]|uniref:TonB-dependent receptor domain-containing protein n=1 Tax=Sphingomonas asaccharolytica TaxID=40681 RepID=UPI000A02CA40|nr:TonB-dependent receptor [Sphingomonas asaccharolytica]
MSGVFNRLVPASITAVPRETTGSGRLRLGLKAALLVGSAVLPATGAMAQQTPPQTPDATQPAAQSAEPTTPPNTDARSDGQTLNDIVVVGNTSGKRTLFNSSSDVTLANAADIQRKAPRSTAEALELVPGIFVEGTAGAVSNNYSVRGLRGGAQTFIQLEEDGMPIIYGGGGADEYFQNDITIDRLEAVEGGTSGVLAVNGAAATINFISLKPSYDRATAMARFTGTSYGELRTDGYFSAPLADNVAFSVGGYVTSNPGFRRSDFDYTTYHFKAMLETKFAGGGFLRFTFKKGDQHDAYYADMPFTSNGGKIGDVPGLNGLRDNIAGRAFGQILVPDSCATGTCLRPFSLADGIHTQTTQYRIDLEKPITDKISVFARARYLKSSFDFNGIFPGSNGQPPASAVTYLTQGISPLDQPVRDAQGNIIQPGFLTRGAMAFPGTTSFGIRNVVTGQVIPVSDTATLNALNGNGLLQQTVLNHQRLDSKDFGSDFGVKFDFGSGAIDNSLTIGGMYYNVTKYNDQSATASLINDVTNGSNIYDVVALNAQNNVIGQLTNNGMVSYGDWGQGIFKDKLESISGYFNDELKIGDNLHIDFGARYEHVHDRVDMGNSYAVNPPVPAGTPGIIPTLGQSFNGTYTRQEGSYDHLAATAGINYTLTRNFSVYARYARGFQTSAGDNGGIHQPANLTLYEAGVRFQSRMLVGSLVAFKTEFRNQGYTFLDPSDPTKVSNATADDNIKGIQLDFDLKPVDFFKLSLSGVYQDPKLQNLRFDGTAQPQYEGNTPERTPKKLLTVTPQFILPGGLGEIYGRYKYIGKIYADAGNGVALPAYGVFSVGGSINLSSKINLNVSVDNLTNVRGYTEGNPRQGQTQSIVNGYFYGRGIVGRNVLASITAKF